MKIVVDTVDEKADAVLVVVETGVNMLEIAEETIELMEDLTELMVEKPRRPSARTT